MNKFILMHNAYTSTMVATTALATAIGAATTAVADYPVLDSQGSTAMDESFFDRAVNWTNATLQIYIPPNDPEASSYDYLTATQSSIPQHRRPPRVSQPLLSGEGCENPRSAGKRRRNEPL